MNNRVSNVRLFPISRLEREAVRIGHQDILSVWNSFGNLLIGLSA
jgi:hypothetical protein